MEIVNLGRKPADDVSSGDYPNSEVGHGFDFNDALSDAVSKISDLTERSESDIMSSLQLKFPDFFGVFGPSETMDQFKRNETYNVVVRF